MSNSTSIIIFGASGDLTARKLIPALYNLYIKGRLPDKFQVIGVSRSEFSHEEFRNKMAESTKEHNQNGFAEETFSEFANRVFYVAGNGKEIESIRKLETFLNDLEDGATDRLYYLSTAPFLYEPIMENLGTAGMNRSEDGWRRIIIEKPFGYDLESARVLNDKTHEVFEEDQVYRIDHYLGKETAQNILFFRFANSIFEPLWNRKYIDHVLITVAESVDVGRRAGYYDTSGVMRDMFQNHLLQLLALVAMEPPSSFAATSLRNERWKVLQSVRTVKLENTIRAQYDGYLQAEGVAENSQTPTYAALKLEIGNWRWDGVPFYLRSGKAMKRKTSEITVQFQPPPHLMLNSEEMRPRFTANRLTIRIQPDEGIDLAFEAKVPDSARATRTVDMDFSYADSFGEGEIPEAYERLLLDAILGDASLFTRGDGIETQWSIVDQVIKGWETDEAPPMEIYEPGTWGPQGADELLARDGNVWYVDYGRKKQ